MQAVRGFADTACIDHRHQRIEITQLDSAFESGQIRSHRA
jgi:hypothetical protein